MSASIDEDSYCIGKFKEGKRGLYLGGRWVSPSPFNSAPVAAATAAVALAYFFSFFFLDLPVLRHLLVAEQGSEPLFCLLTQVFSLFGKGAQGRGRRRFFLVVVSQKPYLVTGLLKEEREKMGRA